jgi:hypothetical protein
MGPASPLSRRGEGSFDKCVRLASRNMGRLSSKSANPTGGLRLRGERDRGGMKLDHAYCPELHRSCTGVTALTACTSMICASPTRAAATLSTKPDAAFKLATYATAHSAARLCIAVRDRLLDLPTVNSYVEKFSGSPTIAMPSAMRSLITSIKTLCPGDIFATDLQADGSAARRSPVFFKPDDVVTVDFQELGTLVTPFAA